MTIFNFLTLLGSLSLFLFGMSVMGTALEKRAGGSLKAILAKLTNGNFSGLLTGLAVTAVIQSSSATTVMVVGFVNSGLLSLKQSIPVIMGANIGTTVTAWLLSLSGISGDSLFVQLLKPSSFTPILAVIGIVLYLTAKGKKKDTGLILLGFATLMFGMESLSGSVSGLRNDPNFTKFFLLFSNPILGVLAGAILTGIVQSSSASVGILQALSSTGAVSYGAAIPIIMGQNIGTCVTAMLSSVGTNKNARRAAVVHLSFNIIGTVVWLALFEAANAIFRFAFVSTAIDTFHIALIHSIFNLACTLMLLPCCGLLSYRIIPDGRSTDTATVLDERLFATPAIALVKSEELAKRMAADSELALHESLQAVLGFTPELAASVRQREDDTDRYEDTLGTFLVHLATQPMSEQDSVESSKLLHLIGDFERIADHAVNIIESAEELKEKGVSFTDSAKKELQTMLNAVSEIVDLTSRAFLQDDLTLARQVEPLEQVIDKLKDKLRTNHIARLQRGECSLAAGFVLSDLLTNLERVADHCSNIAGCLLDMKNERIDLHKYLGDVKSGSNEFLMQYNTFEEKYKLA
jgi:phosphate:Na+ symporter